MSILILVIVLIVLVLWFVSTQRKLVAMDENINNAMSQIGVQLSSRWDALSALLDLTKGYAEHEYKTLSNTIKMRAGITSKSTAADVNNQENILTEASGKLSRIKGKRKLYQDNGQCQRIRENGSSITLDLQ